MGRAFGVFGRGRGALFAPGSIAQISEFEGGKTAPSNLRTSIRIRLAGEPAGRGVTGELMAATLPGLSGVRV